MLREVEYASFRARQACRCFSLLHRPSSTFFCMRWSDLVSSIFLTAGDQRASCSTGHQQHTYPQASSKWPYHRRAGANGSSGSSWSCRRQAVHRCWLTAAAMHEPAHRRTRGKCDQPSDAGRRRRRRRSTAAGQQPSMLASTLLVLSFAHLASAQGLSFIW